MLGMARILCLLILGYLTAEVIAVRLSFYLRRQVHPRSPCRKEHQGYRRFPHYKGHQGRRRLYYRGHQRRQRFTFPRYRSFFCDGRRLRLIHRLKYPKNLCFRDSSPKCPLKQDEEPGCKVITSRPVRGQVSGVGAFNYLQGEPNGPEGWNVLDCKSKSFSVFQKCSYCTNVCDGDSQTPINIITGKAKELPASQAPLVDLKRSKLRYEIVALNFELVCVEEGTCGGTVFNKREFKFAHVHAHYRSEHTLNNKDFPVEIHFVHKSGDSVLVLGLFVKLGRFNRGFQDFLNVARLLCEDTISLNMLVGKAFDRRNVVHYRGSLTTPPCSEGLFWVVSTSPITASLRQVGDFRRLLGFVNNNRPIQALNGRDIFKFK